MVEAGTGLTAGALAMALTHPPTTWRLALSPLPSRDHYPFVGGLLALTWVFLLGALSVPASSSGVATVLLLAFLYSFTAMVVACVMGVAHDLRD